MSRGIAGQAFVEYLSFVLSEAKYFEFHILITCNKIFLMISNCTGWGG
jgi:hypothetical protein